MEKLCPGCNKVKPLEEFVKDARREHGRGAHCVICRRERSKQNRKSRRKPADSGFAQLQLPPLTGRPLLLDLFSGAGGASVGYYRAGFDVVGVDHLPPTDYPFFIINADVNELLDQYLLAGVFPFDAIHASPPCQKFSSLTVMNEDEYPDLVGITRAQLKMFDVPWIIENVPNAPLRQDVKLCGSMFGLGVRRHRIFEASFPIRTPPSCDHSTPIVGVYGNNAGEGIAKAKVAMDIPWMNKAYDIVEAIPPAYTEWLGADLLSRVSAGKTLTAP